MGTQAEDLRTEIDRLHRAAGGQTTEPRGAFTAAQSRAEPIYCAFGDSAPPHLQGESVLDYRVRLAAPFKQYSTKFKDSDLSKVADAAVFGSVEDSIYQDAQRSRTDSSNFTPGELKAVRRADSTGRVHTSFHGDPHVAWAAFSPPPRYAKFLTPAVR